MPFLNRVLPEDSLPKARHLLQRYGFLSLFISCFIPFVRVLTPMLILSFWRTLTISISSSVIWCLLLMLVGKWLMIHPRLNDYQEVISKAIVITSFVLMLAAIIGLLYCYLTSRKRNLPI